MSRSRKGCKFSLADEGRGIARSHCDGCHSETGNAPFIAADRSCSHDADRSGFILVLFTYGGWNEIAYLAGEIQRPEKTLVRAFLGGTLIVTLLYLLINLAFIRVLGMEGMARHPAVASVAMERMWPELGGRLASILICISTLGPLTAWSSRISHQLLTGC